MPMPSEIITDRLKKFPTSDFYRFLTDGRLHQKEYGWLAYASREPGCLPALYDAFGYALSHELQQPDVSIDLLKAIHTRVTAPINQSAMNAGQFRPHGTFFPLVPDNAVNGYCNEEGFKELVDFARRHQHQHSGIILQQKQTLDDVKADISKGMYQSKSAALKAFREVFDTHLRAEDHSAVASFSDFQTGKKWHFRAPSKELIPALLESLFAQYNVNIRQAKDDEERIHCVVSMVQECERIHPFSDGNGRTSLILLQRLLIQNGFLPTMMENPNHLDAHDLKSVIAEIKIGMGYTQALIANPEALIFNHKTEDINCKPEDIDSEPEDPFEAEMHLKTETEAEKRLYAYVPYNVVDELCINIDEIPRCYAAQEALAAIVQGLGALSPAAAGAGINVMKQAEQPASASTSTSALVSQGLFSPKQKGSDQTPKEETKPCP